MRILAGFMAVVFDTPIFWTLPVFVLIAFIVILQHRLMWVTIVGALLFSLASLCLIYGVALIWALRDGLGPDGINSQGATAIAHFMSGAKDLMPIVLFVSAFPLFAGLALYRFNKERRHKLSPGS